MKVREFLLSAVLLGSATMAFAQSPPAPPPKTEPALTEVEVDKIQQAQKDLLILDERHQKLQAQIELVRTQYALKMQERGLLVTEAAKRAGVDPAQVEPDLATKTWKKK